MFLVQLHGYPTPFSTRLKVTGVPVVAQWLTNMTRNLEDAGLILGLAQGVKDLAVP